MLIECSEEYIESSKIDLDNLNSLINPFEYKYIDYSDLPDEEEERFDLYEMIRTLENMDVTRDDIAKTIKNVYAEKLFRNGV